VGKKKICFNSRPGKEAAWFLTPSRKKKNTQTLAIGEKKGKRAKKNVGRGAPCRPLPEGKVLPF